jgi:hypothetical protein
MGTRTDVPTASIVARGSLERVREAVRCLGRPAWVAPGSGGWVLVLPEAPAAGEVRDPIDPYDLVGFGRGLCDAGLVQVLVLSVRAGLGVSQLMSRDHDTAFIAWRTAESGEPPVSRVEPDAFTFCSRFGVPERTELVELILEDRTGAAAGRLSAFCLALGLPLAAIGATAELLGDESLHLPGAERLRPRRAPAPARSRETLRLWRRARR